MKHLLAGTAMLGFVVSGFAARATPIDFTFTGSVVDFTIPTTDVYQILAFGAQGGNALSNFTIGPGGLGAEIGGDFTLAAGETLQIAVGGAGGDATAGGFGAAGGGGGSFVVGPGITPLVIAGGGGGGGFLTFPPMTPIPGGAGLVGQDGGNDGGIDGNGGRGGFLGGAGGGGLFSDGGGTQGEVLADGGGAFPGLAGGFPTGAFGGGGGGGLHGSGGGGGYSGGAGAPGFQLGAILPGGGGGSFDAGTEQILIAGIRSGDGDVIITEIPEPGSLALLGTGLVLAACLLLSTRFIHRSV